jgi:type IV fimbrial biogenesis protein FimT
MRQLNRNPVRGLTLIELAMTLLLLSMLLVLSAPGMADYLRNSKLREAGHAAATALQFARNEAIKRNEPISVRVLGTRLSVVDGNGVELMATQGSSGISAVLRAPDDSLVDPPLVRFSGAGRTHPLGNGFKVDVSLAGTPCDDEHRCPRVMVRPGGAVRLCKTQVDC